VARRLSPESRYLLHRAPWTIKELEDVKLARVKALAEDGCSVRHIADETGFSKSSVQRMRHKLQELDH
jgi:transposase